MLCGSYMHKGWEGVYVKARHEFGNDPMKMCFKHKTKMIVDHEFKILKLCRIMFLSHRLWFYMKFFCHEFSMFGHAHIIVFIIVVYTHLKVLHKWFSSHYVWLCEKKTIENIKEPKKEICIILFSGF